MPQYSVTISLTRDEPAEIVDDIVRTFGVTVGREARITLSERPNYCDDPCRRQGHFGCVHWTDDDVEARFHDLKIPMTPQLLAAVKENIHHIDDSIVELGWEIIESAIREVAETAP